MKKAMTMANPKRPDLFRLNLLQATAHWVALLRLGLVGCFAEGPDDEELFDRQRRLYDTLTLGSTMP